MCKRFSTKSRISHYRDIPVPPTLRWCAQEIRKVDTKFIWEKRKRDTPCNPSNFRDEFKEVIGKIEGVRVLTHYSCRHTYVSQMQALGVDLSTIQSIVCIYNSKRIQTTQLKSYAKRVYGQ